MAESISEGTLKQFTKQVGDFVEQDEEIATIETDKIDVAVNAPESGTILEFFAKEEDTVKVGQYLLKLELGDAPAESSGKQEAKEEAKEEPKAPADKEQKPGSKQTPSEEQKEPKTVKEESKPAPPKRESKPEPPKEQPKPAQPSSDQPFGNREERRVCFMGPHSSLATNMSRSK